MSVDYEYQQNTQTEFLISRDTSTAARVSNKVLDFMSLFYKKNIKKYPTKITFLFLTRFCN
jgi:hypothetical protein